MSARNRERWGVSPEAAARCVTLGGGRRLEPLPGVRVETLTSTDEGVAFLVTADGQTVFHAGDLNWWHWEGEDVSWNTEMALHFQEFTAPLRGKHIDLAMLPLDPRLGRDGFRGPRYFLELADIAVPYPCHSGRILALQQVFGRISSICRSGGANLSRSGRSFCSPEAESGREQGCAFCSSAGARRSEEFQTLGILCC